MVFSVPTFTSVGDDYDKKINSGKPKPGRCFVTSGPKQGMGIDVTFEKAYKSIHEGDPYIDPGTAERRAKLESSKKRVVPEGFKLSSPPQKASGLGGYFGTFQKQPIPHETDYIVPRKGDKPARREPAPRPIFTAPTRKGTYGVAGTLLSKEGTEYVADFYDAKKVSEKEDHEKHKKLMKGAPWKGCGRKGFTFDESYNTGAPQCYVLTKPLEPKKEFKSKVQGHPQSVAWKPGGVVPTKLPPIEYREDPYDGHDPREAPRKKTADESKGPSWRPNGATNDTWYTKSIAFARL